MNMQQAQALLGDLESIVEQSHRLQLSLLHMWQLVLAPDEPTDPAPVLEQAILVDDDTLPDKPTFRVEEVATMLGISRSSAYRAAQLGQIPSFRVGRRMLVPRTALLRLLTAGEVL